MGRLRQWCEDINRVQADVNYDFVYVDEESIEKYKPTSFRQLLEAFKDQRENLKSIVGISAFHRRPEGAGGFRPYARCEP